MTDLHPYAIWVCLRCGTQDRGPGGHHVGGDDICSNCGVLAGEGESPQPRLARVAVQVVDEGTRGHLHGARRRLERAVKEQQRERREAR